MTGDTIPNLHAGKEIIAALQRKLNGTQARIKELEAALSSIDDVIAALPQVDGPTGRCEECGAALREHLEACTA